MEGNFVNFVENDYQCPICYESFAFAIRLNEHSEMHFGKNTIKKEIEENSEETFIEPVPIYRIKRVSFDNPLMPNEYVAEIKCEPNENFNDYKYEEISVSLNSPFDSKENEKFAANFVFKSENILTESSNELSDRFIANQLVWGKVCTHDGFWPAIVINIKEWNMKECPPGKRWVYWIGSREGEHFSQVKTNNIVDFGENYAKFFVKSHRRKCYKYGTQLALKFFIESGQNLSNQSDFKPVIISDDQWQKVIKAVLHRPKTANKIKRMCDDADENVNPLGEGKGKKRNIVN